mgnify:FL=1
MIRHVVIFRWQPDTEAAAVAAVSSGLTDLAARMLGVVRYEHGPDVGINEGNFDYAVVADFDDVDAFVEYRDHPEHRALIVERIAPHLAERVAVQFEV